MTDGPITARHFPAEVGATVRFGDGRLFRVTGRPDASSATLRPLTVWERRRYRVASAFGALRWRSARTWWRVATPVWDAWDWGIARARGVIRRARTR